MGRRAFCDHARSLLPMWFVHDDPSSWASRSRVQEAGSVRFWVLASRVVGSAPQESDADRWDVTRIRSTWEQ